MKLLLLKAHVAGHDRHLAGGQVVRVTEHDDRRSPAEQTIIPKEWEDHGKRHPGGVKEYRRTLPDGHPDARHGRKHVYIRHFDTGEAHNVYPSGYIGRYDSLQTALDHMDKVVFHKE